MRLHDEQRGGCRLELEDAAHRARDARHRLLVVNHHRLRLGVARPPDTFHKARLALEVARAACFLREHHNSPVAEPDQNSRRMPAHRAMVEIAKRQVQARVSRAGDDAREIVFTKPALHAFVRAHQDPAAVQVACDEFLQSRPWVGAEVMVPVKYPQPHAALAQQRAHVVDPQVLHRPQPLDRLRRQQRHILRTRPRAVRGVARDDLIAGAMDRPDQACGLHLRQRHAQGVAAHPQQLAQRALARQPVPPLAILDLGVEKRDRLGDERLALGENVRRHATGDFAIGG